MDDRCDMWVERGALRGYQSIAPGLVYCQTRHYCDVESFALVLHSRHLLWGYCCHLVRKKTTPLDSSGTLTVSISTSFSFG